MAWNTFLFWNFWDPMKFSKFSKWPQSTKQPYWHYSDQISRSAREAARLENTIRQYYLGLRLQQWVNSNISFIFELAPPHWLQC